MPATHQPSIVQTELQLVLLACRGGLGVNVREQLTQLLGSPLDENRLIAVCEEHRLLLVVFRVLVAPNRELFSKELFARLESLALKKTSWHLILGRWVLETHALFSGAGIPHVYVKGPLLNDRLFPGRVLRYSKDIDVLVSRDRLLDADRLLRDAGFFGDRNPLEIQRYLSMGRLGRKDITYTKPGSKHAIELHWKLDQAATDLGEERAPWSARAQFQLFHGSTVPVLKETPNLLYLCLHGAGHAWQRLIWLLDIAVILKELDLERLLVEAKRRKLQTVVFEALVLCRRYFGMDFLELGKIPKGILERIENNVNARMLSAEHSATRVFYDGLVYEKTAARIACWSVSSAVALRLRYRGTVQSLGLTEGKLV